IDSRPIALDRVCRCQAGSPCRLGCSCATMQESYRSLKRHGHFRIIATPYSMVIFQGVAIMLPGIAGDAAAVWHPRETAYGSSSFSTGTITHQNSDQGYLLTRDDCMSKMGTKHVSMAREPVNYLNHFGETDPLLEQNTELAKKCLVRVLAGARYDCMSKMGTKETFDQF